MAINYILNFRKNNKSLIVLVNDIILYTFSLWLSFVVRLEEVYIPSFTHIKIFTIFLILFVIISFITGLYRELFRYIRANSILLILKSIAVYAVLTGFIIIFIGINGVPRSIAILHPIFLLLLITLSRVVAVEIISITLSEYNKDRKNILIYGAGNTGNRFISSLDKSSIFNVKGFIDDNKELDNQHLNSYLIQHSSKLGKIIEKENISHILLALPYLNLTKKVDLINKIEKFNVKIITLPSLDDLALGKIKINQIKTIDINDLLGRVAISGHQDLLKKNITNKNILVSGAGGSIGSELCKHILLSNPNKLILVDQSEIGIFNIQNQLIKLQLQKNINFKIIPALGNICNYTFLENLFGEHEVHTIYHAAAYKHVDLVEKNPLVAIQNNVFGTMNLYDISKKHDVINFTLISSDKAVNPINIMGATKRISEMILSNEESKNSKTNYSIVRFGNVLGSSGSVVTLFRKQLSDGGPLIVRDINLTRYFMTIEEASQLVIQAGSMSTSGDIFLLEMGSPVKIIDLARKIIELGGMTVKNAENPRGDIEIKITGLVPGEKIHEELYINKNIKKTIHPKIYRVIEKNIKYKCLILKLEKLKSYIENNNIEKTKELVFDLVK